MNKRFFFSLVLILALPAFAEIRDRAAVPDRDIADAPRRADVGRVAFIEKPVPVESSSEADFLKEFELREPCDLNIVVFLKEPLTRSLSALAPGVDGDELNGNGNFRVSFFVDSRPVYSENLPFGAGTAESKKTRTVFRVPLISTIREDSWGRFLWFRFLMNGGEEALTSGAHVLGIEFRPYVKAPDLRIGGPIAAGRLTLIVHKPRVDPGSLAPQAIRPGSGFPISDARLDGDKIRDMNVRIAERTFKDITSVVVLENGRLLVEEYFNGADRGTLHNTRSVGKSFASALMGIAIRDGRIKSVGRTLGEFYDLARFANGSPKKAAVTLENLLTMSSGFAGNDDDENSPGYEEKMYPTDDWVKFALDLPMDDSRPSGSSWRYFTAGVVVLGDILHRAVPGGLEKYADEKLFKPLGITEYQWQYTPQKVANTAGGLSLSSLDYARFGQLYKNGGVWNGRQIIPRAWIDASLSKKIALPGDGSGFYGYLFWNKTFLVDGRPHEAAYCTGNGGNKIYVFKDLPLVVVVTATAFNKPYAHPQVDRIMEKYLLPAVTK